MTDEITTNNVSRATTDENTTDNVRRTASESDHWSTPDPLFEGCSKLYGPYDIDVAASAANHKCDTWINESQNALVVPWGAINVSTQRVWCNPPYSRGNKPAFFAKARAEMAAGHCDVITLLVPHNTAEAWWHEYVDTHGPVLAAQRLTHELGPRTVVHTAELVIETLAIRGRVKFVETTGSTYKQATAPFSSAAVTFSRPGVLYPLVTAPRRRGRPSTVTEAAAWGVRQLVARGASVARACEVTGVSERAWYRYAKRGET